MGPLAALITLGKDRANGLAYALLALVILLGSLPVLSSGGRLNLNADFFQYAARHETVRKSLLEYHELPLRSPWFGGGFPTLGDPEDPTLNPLILPTVLFGAVVGLKLIGVLAILVGGLSTYAYAQKVLGYTGGAPCSRDSCLERACSYRFVFRTAIRMRCTQPSCRYARC